MKNRTNMLLGLLIAGPFTGAGCAIPHATVELLQPAESGSQGMIALSSEWAKYGHSTDGVSTHLILEWALPGSRYGTKQYLLYVRLPSGTGAFEVGDPILPGSEQGDSPPESASDSDVVSGFFIQRTGRLQGVTHFVSGTIEVRGGALTRGTLDLFCADRTEIRGEYVANPGFRASFFERKHEQDIADAIRTARGQPSPQPAALE